MSDIWKFTTCGLCVSGESNAAPAAIAAEINNFFIGYLSLELIFNVTNPGNQLVLVLNVIIMTTLGTDIQSNASQTTLFGKKKQNFSKRLAFQSVTAIIATPLPKAVSGATYCIGSEHLW